MGTLDDWRGASPLPPLPPVDEILPTCCILSMQQQSCSYSSSGVGAQMSGSIGISCGSEDDLQSAVANVGPVSVAVDASNNAFRVRMGGSFIR